MRGNLQRVCMCVENYSVYVLNYSVYVLNYSVCVRQITACTCAAKYSVCGKRRRVCAHVRVCYSHLPVPYRSRITGAGAYNTTVAAVVAHCGDTFVVSIVQRQQRRGSLSNGKLLLNVFAVFLLQGRNYNVSSTTMLLLA